MYNVGNKFNNKSIQKKIALLVCICLVYQTNGVSNSLRCVSTLVSQKNLKFTPVSKKVK